MIARFSPEIIWAFNPVTCRAWEVAPGGWLLIKTAPIPRSCGALRLSVRVTLGAREGAMNRFALRPEQVDEEGLLLFRFPKEMSAHALLTVRLCHNALAGRARILLCHARA